MTSASTRVRLINLPDTFIMRWDTPRDVVPSLPLFTELMDAGATARSVFQTYQLTPSDFWLCFTPKQLRTLIGDDIGMADWLGLPLFDAKKKRASDAPQERVVYGVGKIVRSPSNVVASQATPPPPVPVASSVVLLPKQKVSVADNATLAAAAAPPVSSRPKVAPGVRDPHRVVFKHDADEQESVVVHHVHATDSDDNSSTSSSNDDEE
jgi:hypothetical protein